MTIRNSQELQASQRWLSTRERILEDLRQTVLPPNPKLYEAMSERYIEEIVNVRRDISDYLEIKPGAEFEEVEVR